MEFHHTAAYEKTAGSYSMWWTRKGVEEIPGFENVKPCLATICHALWLSSSYKSYRPANARLPRKECDNRSIVLKDREAQANCFILPSRVPGGLLPPLHKNQGTLQIMQKKA
jgi:hypothetical protein